MGMVCTFRRLPEGDFTRLHAHPELISEYLEEDASIEGFGLHVELDVDNSRFSSAASMAAVSPDLRSWSGRARARTYKDRVVTRLQMAHLKR
jgi:hypothetical protein